MALKLLASETHAATDLRAGAGHQIVNMNCPNDANVVVEVLVSGRTVLAAAANWSVYISKGTAYRAVSYPQVIAGVPVEAKIFLQLDPIVVVSGELLSVYLHSDSDDDASVAASSYMYDLAYGLPAVLPGTSGGLPALDASLRVSADAKAVRGQALGANSGANFNTLFNNGAAASAIILSDLLTMGSGAVTWDLSFTLLDGATPIPDAGVKVTTDAAGTLVVAGWSQTNSLGVARMLLDAGVYYCWMQKSGYNPITGTTFTVAVGGTGTGFMTAAATAAVRGTSGWACDELERFMGGTVTAGVALRYVQMGYGDFLKGADPRRGHPRHTWSFLTCRNEITLGQSKSSVGDGTYVAAAVGRVLGNITLVTDTAIFASTDVDRYVTVEGYGTYRISAYTNTTTVTLEVLTGQRAETFTDGSCWLEAMYQLPADFGGLAAPFKYGYSSSADTPTIYSRTPEVIRAMWRDNNSADAPFYYAIESREFAAATGQRWVLMVAPRPDAARIWTYRYNVIPRTLADDGSFLAGGETHWETINMAAVAYRELLHGGSKKAMWENYDRLMIGSIEYDKDMIETSGPLSTATNDD